MQVQIPVSGINIGPVHKKDIMRANIMAEKKLKKYACILAFDVPITREAQQLATSLGVTLFAADIIYHLFDMFAEYTKGCKAEEKEAAGLDAVFPARLRIVPGCVFNKKDPLVLGCEVVEGQLRVGTPLTVPIRDCCDLGRVTGLEKDHKAVDKAERCDPALDHCCPRDPCSHSSARVRRVCGVARRGAAQRGCLPGQRYAWWTAW
jgi:translation initiation factor 5B